MGQRKFQIVKVVQDRNLIREIRVFRVLVEFSSTFSTFNAIFRCEESIRCGSVSAARQKDPSF